MLGGGNPVGGANPAGTSQSLNVIGDHCYASSGKITTGNTPATMLKFSTGNYYCVVNVSYSSTLPSAGGSDNYELAIEYNGEAFMEIETANSAADSSPNIQLNKILIPPYTNVTIKTFNRSQDVDHDTFISIAGRVYA